MNKYFDNAATSFPKPQNVGEEVLNYLNKTGGPYGRSFYKKALDVAVKVEDTREKLAELLKIYNPDNLAFSPNATFGLNTIIKSIVYSGSEVLVSGMEHNAVMRPLHQLGKERDFSMKYLPTAVDGTVITERINEVVTDKTSLAVINHQSNVNGVIQPVKEIKQTLENTPVLLDIAQSFGAVDIQLDDWGIDYAAFTGHKSLLGPTGIGGFYMKNPELISPLITGGTGSRSESYEYPQNMPDKFEGGTFNIAGIYGLYGALANKPAPYHTNDDFFSFIKEIKKLKKFSIYSAVHKQYQGNVFSIKSKEKSCSELCRILSDKYGISTRAGLHCAPLAHKTLKTFPEGTLRISPSIYHTLDDFNYVIKALAEI
ncbi:MAG: aminotransferase class V-fold PLP-dependent enzyme [Victivallales bacterium]|nr:aminotransferase class V-fold PLP-dependent enzyme [Victivallales bacterium]MCF7888509.1 aminotransferase class V-fold PLP-dependent enzyme [Victivallales bacterium]